MKAKDIMETVDQSISHTDTIRTAVKKMANARRSEGVTGVRGLHVVDDNGKLLGMLSMMNILDAVHPAYMEMGEDLSAFTWDGMLESLVQKAADKLVREIMSSTIASVQDDAPLMECLDVILKNRIRRLPVVNTDGQVIGMIYLRDLYNVVMKTLIDNDEGGK